MSYQRDAVKPLKVAVVGAGSHGYRNILPTMTYLPVRVVAVCDAEPARAKVTAAQYGARPYTSTSQMYDEQQLDAVFLCVSPELHPALAVEAFAAGLHVWMEKPPAMRASEVDEMIARRGDRVAVVGFKKVFMPAARKARELLDTNQIGNLGSMLGVYAVSVPPNGEGVLRDRAVTPWLYDGCHPISLLVAIGGSPETVSTFRGASGGGVCVIHFTTGAVATLHLAEGSPLSQPFERYAFFGETGAVEIDNSNRISLQRGIPYEYTETTDFAPPGIDSGAVVWAAQTSRASLENNSLFVQGFFDEMKYFCDCVLQGRPATRGTLEFGRQVMATYEAALLSNGDAVRVEA